MLFLTSELITGPLGFFSIIRNLEVSSRINEVDPDPNLKMPLIQQPRQKRWAAGGGAAQLSHAAHFNC